MKERVTPGPVIGRFMADLLHGVVKQLVIKSKASVI